MIDQSNDIRPIRKEGKHSSIIRLCKDTFKNRFKEIRLFESWLWYENEVIAVWKENSIVFPNSFKQMKFFVTRQFTYYRRLPKFVRRKRKKRQSTRVLRPIHSRIQSLRKTHLALAEFWEYIHYFWDSTFNKSLPYRLERSIHTGIGISAACNSFQAIEKELIGFAVVVTENDIIDFLLSNDSRNTIGSYDSILQWRKGEILILFGALQYVNHDCESPLYLKPGMFEVNIVLEKKKQEFYGVGIVYDADEYSMETDSYVISIGEPICVRYCKREDLWFSPCLCSTCRSIDIFNEMSIINADNEDDHKSDKDTNFKQKGIGIVMSETETVGNIVQTTKMRTLNKNSSLKQSISVGILHHRLQNRRRMEKRRRTIGDFLHEQKTKIEKLF